MMDVQQSFLLQREIEMEMNNMDHGQEEERVTGKG